jgi:hypothetical protein
VADHEEAKLKDSAVKPLDEKEKKKEQEQKAEQPVAAAH